MNSSKFFAGAAMCGLAFLGCGGGVETASLPNASPPVRNDRPETTVEVATPGCGDADATWKAVMPLGFDAGGAIWGSGANDVYVSGTGPQGASNAGLHFDGKTWSPAEWKMEQAHALCGNGPNDVYVASGSGDLEHFDGTRWTAITDNLLYVPPLFCAGANNVYSGDRRWDGQAVHEYSPGGPVKVVGGTGTNDVFAADRQAFHFDGRTWTEIPLGAAAPTMGFTEIQSVAPGIAIGLGQRKDIVRLTATKAEIIPPAPGMSDGNQHVWGASSDDFIVVGVGAAFHYKEGGGWNQLNLPAGSEARAIWGSRRGNVYIVTKDMLYQCTR